MKNLEKHIKLLAMKTKELTKYTVIKFKEYGKKVKVVNSEFSVGKELTMPNIHFNFHHFVSVILVALFAFFVTSYTTKFNTKAVDAYSEEVQADVINKEAIDVNYGDLKEIAEEAKMILKDEVSHIMDLKTISATAEAGIYELDNYVIHVKLQEPKLGEQVATLTIETKEEFNKSDDDKLRVTATEANFAKGTKTTYQVAIDVIDTVAPIITLSLNDTTIEATDEFDVKDYISIITDNFNGSMSDYTVEGEVAKDGDDYKSGKYVLTIRAKDASGNEGAAELIVRVKEKEVKVEVEEKKQNSIQYGAYAESAYAGSVVAEARAQIGKPYVFGSAGPNAFDCSGLVQYVYARSGISIPRTSGGQATVGVAINPNDVSQWRAGDIVTFGPGGSAHAAIYSGHGTYIHALNPSQGIQETGMHGYFGMVYSVRRVQ